MNDISITEVAAKSAAGATWPELGKEYGCNGEMLRGRWRRWRKRDPDAWLNVKKGNPPAKPIIQGLFPDDDLIDPDALWQLAIKQQRRMEERARLRLDQSVTIKDDLPFGVAFFSDLHMGNPSTDYHQAREDATVVGETDGLYGSFHGDGIDSWIIGRLQANQRNQIVGYEGEKQLFFNWLDLIGPENLLWFIPGNHDLWGHKEAGIDIFRERLRGTKVLYGRHEVFLTVKQGGASWKILARHKWRGSSVFNDTHGIEVSWERRGLDFDIGIGGHTHRATLCREFIRQGKKRLAILTGTYKVDGDYGRELGYAEPSGLGCGAVIFFPNGDMHWCRTLQEAATFLGYLRRPVPCDSAA